MNKLMFYFGCVVGEAIKAAVWLILIGAASYCISFGWHQAKQVVLVNSSAEILSQITVVGE